MKRIFIKAYGKVHGVCFRAYTIEKAKELGINGTASNRPDGTVEVYAEGSKEKLELLLEYCRNNPGYSYVDKVEFQWSDSINEFQVFKVV